MCDEFSRRLEESDEAAVMEPAASALEGQYWALRDLDRMPEALASCDDLLRRFRGQ